MCFFFAGAIQIHVVMPISVDDSNSIAHFYESSNNIVHVYGKNFHFSHYLSCGFEINNGISFVRAEFHNSSAISCDLPSLAVGYTKMYVTNNQINNYASGWIFVHPKITVSSINPTYGSMYGNTEILIKGSAFNNGISVIQCLFGDIAVYANILSNEALVCNSPSHSIGIVNLTLYIDYTIKINTLFTFEFINDIQIIQIIPTFLANVENSIVTVIGNNFGNFSKFCIFEAQQNENEFMEYTLISQTTQINDSVVTCQVICNVLLYVFYFVKNKFVFLFIN